MKPRCADLPSKMPTYALAHNAYHRFGGVRGDARTFALLTDTYETSNTFNPDDYDHIIVACGYRMKTIPIFDRNEVELSPTSHNSGSCVGADGRLFPDHQIYAFGLGVGLRVPIKRLVASQGAPDVRMAFGCINTRLDPSSEIPSSSGRWNGCASRIELDQTPLPKAKIFDHDTIGREKYGAGLTHQCHFEG